MNPARIIPAWHEFVSRRTRPGRDGYGGSGSRSRPIGPPELVECHRHESLLNLAFARPRCFWLLCPYDTGALAPTALGGARRNHPYLCRGGSTWRSSDYASLELASAWLRGSAPRASDGGHRAGVRRRPAQVRPSARIGVRGAGRRQPRPGRRTSRSPFMRWRRTASATEGGTAGCGVWDDERALTCEVRDGGRIEDPLVGRVRPGPDMPGGRGLWLANQLCDLVQIRAVSDGTVVRLHMWH